MFLAHRSRRLTYISSGEVGETALRSLLIKPTTGSRGVLHRPYYEQAKQQIDQLILEGDKYADTLRVASDHLSFLLKRI